MFRNHYLYDLSIYKNKKLIFRIRDSKNLIPGSLRNRAQHLCPEPSCQGDIEHSQVKVSNLLTWKKKLLEYLKQDVILLAGIMRKAQDIYWDASHIDIEGKMTLPSLALSIFRQNFDDSQNWPIHIPNHNEDTFIRRGYYGGHADVYIPYGENLYYYDVNSLYPFIMKQFHMPDGKPKWVGKFDTTTKIDDLYGFIEAYVHCPESIKRPF